MRKAVLAFLTCMLLMLLPTASLGATRALLVACSDFSSQPDLGSSVSGNLHMIGSALLGVSPRLEGLSIEDGTIGTPEALARSIEHALGSAKDGDLSILYLCTHGISSSDDGQTYLLLSDGETETLLTGDNLGDMLGGIAGEKLLILDACFSGAMIGRGEESGLYSPFLLDPSIHVLTSASSHESSWYYDSQQLSTGAVSYFASAIASGLGLYGSAEADLSGDGEITLNELHRYLLVAVPSSTSQLQCTNGDAVVLPAVQRALLSRPLSGFSYGDSLLLSDEPTLDFSFTVTRRTVPAD